MQTDSIQTLPYAQQIVKKKKVFQKPVCKSWSKLQTDSIQTLPNAQQIVKKKRYFKNLYANPGQNCSQILSKPYLMPNKLQREKGTSKTCMQILVKIADRFYPNLTCCLTNCKKKKDTSKPVCKSWSKLQTDSIQTLPNA